MRDEDIKNFSEFLKEFQAETDRGAALVGAALVDSKLRGIILNFLLDSKVSKEIVDGGNAPLSTFSSRIKAAFSLGLIDDTEFKNCELIRKVRNEFAHQVHGLSFDNERITQFCYQFEAPLPSGAGWEKQPRMLFINATICTILRLMYRADWVAKEKRTSKTWPY